MRFVREPASSTTRAAPSTLNATKNKSFWQGGNHLKNEQILPSKPHQVSDGFVSPVPMKVRRIALIDVARGLALIAMASYHFGWDLELFGYLDPRTATTGFMKWYARGIASTFLMLVGVGLFLAHAESVNWRSFFRRIATVGGAALAVTAATYFAIGQGFIFFGILHQIALGSLIGLAFLNLPALIVALAAALFLALPQIFRHAAFNHAWLWWVGLSTADPASSDYVPILPWTGMILAGIAAAKIGHRLGWFGALSRYGPFNNGPGYWLGLAGRHSLAFYLVHQPVLISALYVFSLLSPPLIDQTKNYEAACLSNCIATRDLAFCEKFCPCVQLQLSKAGKFDDLVAGNLDPQKDPTVLGSAAQCTAEAENLGQ